MYPTTLAAAMKTFISRTFTIKRMSRDAFNVAGKHHWSMDKALVACEAECEKRGMSYDFPDYGDARDALEAMKVGESIPVEPLLDDDEDDADDK